ncbi:hypothetical protein KAR91_22655 [Candidatus Pacearchaeota archaeon]|nr:hypothetical protein [Candidatus Pacearchaeota archaeon]
MGYDIQQSNGSINFTATRDSVGDVSVSTVTVRHEQFGAMNQTTLTLAAVAQAVINGTEYQSTKIYDFPEGRILVLGTTATLQQTTTSTLATTLNASSTGGIALGTVAASNVALSSTMVDLLPETAFTSSATINVAGTAVSAALAASAQFDGTTTAKDMYLNTGYETTTDVDGDATQTISGTVVCTWINLGDY